MIADTLHIGDQIPSGVFLQFGVWRRFSAAALIEKDDAVALRIMQTAHYRIDPAPWPPMDHNHGFTIGIAALLQMNAVQFRHFKHLFRIRLVLRVKSICNHASHFQK